MYVYIYNMMYMYYVLHETLVYSKWRLTTWHTKKQGYFQNLNIKERCVMWLQNWSTCIYQLTQCKGHTRNLSGWQDWPESLWSHRLLPSPCCSYPPHHTGWLCPHTAVPVCRSPHSEMGSSCWPTDCQISVYKTTHNYIIPYNRLFIYANSNNASKIEITKKGKDSYTPM